jgi:sugar (pentulose or hexulose) kinase
MLAELAGTSRAGSEGVIFVPYLSASGVIAPRIEPRARAGFHGLAPHHGRAQLARSIYEGMACAIRDCYEAIGGAGEGIRLSGGGARSPFWAQMISDVTGYVVEIPEGTQFGAKGAALCSAVAIGDFGSIGEAVEATYRVKRHHVPNADAKSIYDESFGRFKIASVATLDVLRNVVVTE